MLICRADLEAMLKIMDKFDLDKEFSALDIKYVEHDCSYELSVSFTEIRNGIVCRTTIDIDQDTREHL